MSKLKSLLSGVLIAGAVAFTSQSVKANNIEGLITEHPRICDVGLGVSGTNSIRINGRPILDDNFRESTAALKCRYMELYISDANTIGEQSGDFYESIILQGVLPDGKSDKILFGLGETKYLQEGLKTQQLHLGFIINVMEILSLYI